MNLYCSYVAVLVLRSKAWRSLHLGQFLLIMCRSKTRKCAPPSRWGCCVNRKQQWMHKPIDTSFPLRVLRRSKGLQFAEYWVLGERVNECAVRKHEYPRQGDRDSWQRQTETVDRHHGVPNINPQGFDTLSSEYWNTKIVLTHVLFLFLCLHPCVNSRLLFTNLATYGQQ